MYEDVPDDLFSKRNNRELRNSGITLTVSKLNSEEKAFCLCRCVFMEQPAFPH